MQNLPSDIAWGQIRPAHPALRRSLIDPGRRKGREVKRQKRELNSEDALEVAASLLALEWGHWVNKVQLLRNGTFF